MADQKLSQLPAGAAVTGADLFYSDQGGNSVSQTANAMRIFLGGSASVFNVRNFGAVGNGSTNDTAAINSAIAAFNAAGGGQLYFPFGTYSVPGGALTTLTGTGTVSGDGKFASLVVSGSATGLLFQSSAIAIYFRDMAILTSLGVTPTASVAVTNLTVNSQHHLEMARVYIQNFFTGVDDQEANNAIYDQVWIDGCANYSFRSRNLVTPDSGGNRWLNCACGTGDTTLTASVPVNAVAGWRVESSGNDAFQGCTVYGGTFSGTPHGPLIGVDINPAGATTIVQMSDCSLENYITRALSIQNTNLVNITNLEIGAYSQVGSQAPLFFNTVSQLSICNVALKKSAAPTVPEIDFNSGSCSGVTMRNISSSANFSTPIGLSPLQFNTGLDLPQGGAATVATMRSFVTQVAGWRYFVTDSNQATPAVGQAVAAGDAGGTNFQPIFSDGTVWRYG
jgi:hypothetical protein